MRRTATGGKGAGGTAGRQDHPGTPCSWAPRGRWLVLDAPTRAGVWWAAGTACYDVAAPVFQMKALGNRFWWAKSRCSLGSITRSATCIQRHRQEEGGREVPEAHAAMHALDIHGTKAGSLGSGLLKWMQAWLTHCIRPVQGHVSHLSPAGTYSVPETEPISTTPVPFRPVSGTALLAQRMRRFDLVCERLLVFCDPLALLLNLAVSVELIPVLLERLPGRLLPHRGARRVSDRVCGELSPRLRTRRCAPLRSARGGSLVGRPLVWRPGPGAHGRRRLLGS